MRVKGGTPRNRCKQILLCLRMRGDEVNCRLDGIDLLCLIVGDLEAKFFLKGHDDLDGVQAVQSKVLLEMRIRRHLGGLDLLEVLDDGDDAVGDLALVEEGPLLHLRGGRQEPGDGDASRCRRCDRGARHRHAEVVQEGSPRRRNLCIRGCEVHKLHKEHSRRISIFFSEESSVCAATR